MNILVLHNNNLPDSVFNLNHKDELQNFVVKIEPLSEPPTDKKDFDVFVSESLSKMELKQYNLIVMPLNFTDTYMEYTGLRVAAHIRLTKEWEAQSCPILFLGSDKIEEVMRFSLLGGILSTFNVYYSNKKDFDSLLKIFNWIDKTSLKDVVTDSLHFQGFLERMKLIPAPSNYTSHHSVANEWAIVRWADMLSKRKSRIEIPQNYFSHLLYFKYLMTVAGKRDRFNKRFEDNNPTIGQEPAFDGKRIVLIDDEINKGWEIILKDVIENRSKGVLVPYPFSQNKPIKKNDLIDSIKLFIKEDYNKFGGAHCYILDLRLHDDDFNNDTKYNKLSGHIIAEYIKSKEINPYSQIVFFTASNKVWNYKRAIEETHACGYAVKETPEQNLSRDDSKKLFDELIKVVAHACKKSYLKDFFKDVECLLEDYSEEDLNLLYQFVELLDIDDERNNEALIKSCVFTLSTFIEVFCKERFDITEHDLFRKSDSVFHKSWRDVIYTNSDDLTVRVRNSSSELLPGFRAIAPKNKKDSIEIPDLAYILVPLALYYELSESDLSKIYELKENRNRIAHEGKTEYSKSQLLEVFKVILIKILKCKK